MPLRARTVDEVLAASQGQPRFVVDQLIHRTATLVWGASGSGKTWTMVSQLAAIAEGAAWFGHEVDGPRLCMVLAAAGRWRSAGGPRPRCRRPAAPRTPAPRPGPDPGAWKGIAQDLADDGYGFVVIDNLYSWGGEMDIIKNAEVARALGSVRALTDLGISVAVVHHTSAGGTSIAGVHSIKAFFRHLVYVTADKLGIEGNGTSKTTLRLTREAGRIVAVDEKPQRAAHDSVSSAQGSRRRQIVEVKRQLAREALAAVPELTSAHAQGAYLAEEMPEHFNSAESGRSFLRREQLGGQPTSSDGG